MTYGEIKKRLLAARWCLVDELRKGPFATWSLLIDRQIPGYGYGSAMQSGDGKLMLVLGLYPDNPNGVGIMATPK